LEKNQSELKLLERMDKKEEDIPQAKVKTNAQVTERKEKQEGNNNNYAYDFIN
jgi:hypothetical protein